jgi:hypothetical protein
MLWLFSIGLSLSPSPIDAANIYMTSTGDASLDNLSKTRLESLAYSVTIGVPYTGFNGTLDLSPYQAILLTASANWSSGDMPVNGQTALVNYINSGGGLVTGEWLVWKSAYQFQTLAPVLPVLASTIYSSHSPITYSAATAQPILNAGLPTSFTFAADSFSGTETYFAPKPSATAFYDSNYSSGAKGVIGWDYGQGRVISFSTTIGPNELNNQNYSRLLGNAIAYVGATPQPSTPVISNVTATAGSTFSPAAWMVDGSGMTPNQPVTDKSLAGNSSVAEGMWLSANDPISAHKNWLLFTLDSPQNIREMVIWNHNQNGDATGYQGAYHRGLKNVTITYSTGSDASGDGNAWGSYVLNRASGAALQGCTDELSAPGGRIDNVKAVKITYQSNWTVQGDWDFQHDVRYYGLSEVGFLPVEVPEPSMLLLVGSSAIIALGSIFIRNQLIRPRTPVHPGRCADSPMRPRRRVSSPRN